MGAKRHLQVEFAILSIVLKHSDHLGYPGGLSSLASVLHQKFADINNREIVDTLKRLRPRYITLWKWSDQHRRFLQYPEEIGNDEEFFYRADFRLRHTPETDPYLQTLAIEVDPPECKKGSVMNWKDGVVTRAVLYDIAQLKGAEWVEPGVPITRADLEAWEKKAGVKAGPGDVPLLYIGRWKRREKMGPWTGQVSGYYADTISWMHDRLPAFIGHDFNIDWNPRPGWEGMPNPIHVAVLNWMGINIVESLTWNRQSPQHDD
jgi:hypothetical protein